MRRDGGAITARRSVLVDFMESIVCTTAFVEMMPHVTASRENVTVQVASLEQPVKNHVTRVSMAPTVYISASVCMENPVTKRQANVNVCQDTMESSVTKSVHRDSMGKIVMKVVGVRMGRHVTILPGPVRVPLGGEAGSVTDPA